MASKEARKAAALIFAPRSEPVSELHQTIKVIADEARLMRPRTRKTSTERLEEYVKRRSRDMDAKDAIERKAKGPMRIAGSPGPTTPVKSQVILP